MSSCEVCAGPSPSAALGSRSVVVPSAFVSMAIAVPRWLLCTDCAEAVASGNETLVRFTARVVVAHSGPIAADLAETRALARFDQLRQEFIHGARLKL